MNSNERYILRAVFSVAAIFLFVVVWVTVANADDYSGNAGTLTLQVECVKGKTAVHPHITMADNIYGDSAQCVKIEQGDYLTGPRECDVTSQSGSYVSYSEIQPPAGGATYCGKIDRSPLGTCFYATAWERRLPDGKCGGAYFGNFGDPVAAPLYNLCAPWDVKSYGDEWLGGGDRGGIESATDRGGE